MIFVTVGTHEQPFNRLIQEVDNLKASGVIEDEVIIQKGYSTYEPKYCTCYDLIPYEDMDKYIQEARIVITHGGPASFMAPLSYKKIPIVVPRQKQFNEHVNDHQLEFCKIISEKFKNILLVEDIKQLSDTVKNYEKLSNITATKVSNNKKFCCDLETIIKEDMFGGGVIPYKSSIILSSCVLCKKECRIMKICYVASSGGHWEEIMCLGEIIDKYDSCFVTEEGGQADDSDRKNVYTVPQVNRKEKGFWGKFFRLFKTAKRILKSEKPDVIITTGALIAYPFCLIGKLKKIKVVYIESFARIEGKSLTGKLVYPFADLFIVQWEEMLEYYPKAIYGGSIF